MQRKRASIAHRSTFAWALHASGRIPNRAVFVLTVSAGVARPHQTLARRQAYRVSLVGLAAGKRKEIAFAELDLGAFASANTTPRRADHVRPPTAQTCHGSDPESDARDLSAASSRKEPGRLAWTLLTCLAAGILARVVHTVGPAATRPCERRPASVPTHCVSELDSCLSWPPSLVAELDSLQEGIQCSRVPHHHFESARSGVQAGSRERLIRCALSRLRAARAFARQDPLLLATV